MRPIRPTAGVMGLLLAAILALPATAQSNAAAPASEPDILAFAMKELDPAPQADLSGIRDVLLYARAACLAERRRDDLAALVPEGYRLVDGFEHAFGFAPKPEQAGESFAVSVAGDSVKDEAGGHPNLTFAFPAGSTEPAEHCALQWKSASPNLYAESPDAIALEAINALPYSMWLLGASFEHQPDFVSPDGPLASSQGILIPCEDGWCRGQLFLRIDPDGEEVRLSITRPPG